ncbi:MAG: oligosaccharide flippase family protein [Actinobacteria bacterium]|uniref:Unannotated protein n=1 Tax=freshwater metagenome TaxID=449393 RepID=A0A6J7III7_9ZZZZ|nr:oligosaccharide flippase family protein [Actinomycetota bacterium]MSX87264.1 oligosaccharide flippase family protein [Actinomycetota bacterium]
MAESTTAASPNRSLSRSGGLLLLVSVGVGNAANYGFQIVTGRSLGAQDYGLLGGLMAVATIISVAGGSFQTAAARAVAAGETRPGRDVIDRFSRSAIVAGLVVTAIAMAASPLIGIFFDVGLLPIFGLALLIVPALLSAIAAGRLQGAHRFGLMSGLSAGLALGKLAVAVAAAVIGVGVTSLMFGLALSTFAGGAIGLWLARDIGDIGFGVFSADVGRAMLAFTLFWVMVSADVPFARAFFDGEEAGHYAAAAVLGKAVLWLPSVVGLLVFPRLASASVAGEGATGIMRRAVMLSGGLTVVGVAGLYVLGDPMFRILYGEEYLPAADVAWRIGVACIPLAIVNLLLYERVAHRSNRFLVWLGVGTVAELGGFMAVHSSGSSFALVLVVSATALLGALLVDRAT